MSDETHDQPVEYPMDGTLDLHTFHPREVTDVVTEYIEECLRRGIGQVRIVHGKGIGNLRRTVHAVLNRHPAVSAYRHEGGSGGSWGATVVDLKITE
jgi:dsDNA-specific endonuclease/ATPase MutS2